jgi:hypothetical protein
LNVSPWSGIGLRLRIHTLQDSREIREFRVFMFGVQIWHTTDDAERGN